MIYADYKSISSIQAPLGFLVQRQQTYQVSGCVGGSVSSQTCHRCSCFPQIFFTAGSALHDHYSFHSWGRLAHDNIMTKAADVNLNLPIVRTSIMTNAVFPGDLCRRMSYPRQKALSKWNAFCAHLRQHRFRHRINESFSSFLSRAHTERVTPDKSMKLFLH